jgi:hypothetical protein
MSKTWSDPGCQTGLIVFRVATAVMFLAFVFVVVGHAKALRRSTTTMWIDRATRVRSEP